MLQRGRRPMDELMSMNRSLELSNATLDDFPARIERPRHDRSRLTQEDLAHDRAIPGAGIRPYDAAMREKLIAQDCLTTLVELAPDSRTAEVTGVTIGYLPIEEGQRTAYPGHGRPGDPHRLARGDRGRVLHRRGDGRVRHPSFRYRARCGPSGSSAHRLRCNGRGIASAQGCRSSAVHRPFL